MMSSDKSIVFFNPLSCFPQGGNDFSPSPVGEGWVGGKEYLNSDYYIQKKYSF
jgi:hypothetical protein